MSDKKIIAPLRQLTDLEHLCINGIAQVKEAQGGLKLDGSQDLESTKLIMIVNRLEHNVSLALGEKFGLTHSEIKKSNFDLTIKSGHFVELIDKDEQIDNTSGE